MKQLLLRAALGFTLVGLAPDVGAQRVDRSQVAVTSLSARTSDATLGQSSLPAVVTDTAPQQTHRLWGGILGAGVGAMGGYLIGHGQSMGCVSNCNGDETLAVPFAIGFGLLGALVGAVLGGRF